MALQWPCLDLVLALRAEEVVSPMLLLFPLLRPAAAAPATTVAALHGVNGAHTWLITVRDTARSGVNGAGFARAGVTGAGFARACVNGAGTARAGVNGAAGAHHWPLNDGVEGGGHGPTRSASGSLGVAMSAFAAAAAAAGRRRSPGGAAAVAPATTVAAAGRGRGSAAADRGGDRDGDRGADRGGDREALAAFAAAT